MTFSHLPPRRKPLRSGIERGPKREWARHRAWLRRHQCVVTGCAREPIEVSHIRTAANAGIALRPHDSSAVPMCGGIGPEAHHAEYHRIGHASFEAKYGLNLKATAAELTRQSPDTDMRASLRLVSAEELM